MPRDAPFSLKTKLTIGRRSGFHCSFPGCYRLTMGPGQLPNQYESFGKACHIFAASPGGPRGTGGLSIEDRKSPSNGIWLCSSHADVVDQNEGTCISASELQTWKSLHESRVSLECKGLALSHFGWLQSMTIHNSPLTYNNQKINFGKVTLIIGANNSGKTSICQWLSNVCGDLRDAERWTIGSRQKVETKISIAYCNPSPQNLVATFSNTGIELRRSGSLQLAGLRKDLKCIYISGTDNRRTFVCDFNRILDILRVDQTVFPMIMEHYKAIACSAFADIKWERDITGNHFILGKFKEQLGYYEYGQLSSGEQGAIVMSLAIAAADLESLNQPTLLIVELDAKGFDRKQISNFSALLMQNRFRFQTVFVTHTQNEGVEWSGWSIARLKGEKPRVEISQS